MLRADPFRVTTRHSGSAFPWQCQSALPPVGPFIGYDRLSSGGMFCYDPFALYERHIIGSPNMIVLGQVGHGKSALVKSYLYRQAAFGRVPFVLDPKGEYQGFAQILGLTRLELRPGGPHRLNPLDFSNHQDFGQAGPDGEGADEVFRRRSEIVKALAGAGLRRGLSPSEQAGIDAAVSGLGGSALLGEVVELLFSPSPEMARALSTGAALLKDSTRDAALVLHRMMQGDLAGMFDGPTNVDMARAERGLVIDLSAVYQSDAQPLVMVCAGSWLANLVVRRDGAKRIICVDEAWAVLGDPGMTRWLQSQCKLARQYGNQLVIVTHRLSDLVGQADDASVVTKQAKGLLSDSETRVLYNQPASEADNARELLGLNTLEAKLLTGLPKYLGLWLVGQHVALVDHVLGEAEAAMVDTNLAMRETVR